MNFLCRGKLLLRNKLKIFIRELIYRIALFFLFLIKFLPYDFTVNFGGFLAVFYFKISKDRKIVLENLKTAFPKKTEQEILKLKKDFSVHIGKTLIEFLKMSNKNGVDFEKRCEVVGQENLIEALAQKKGVLLLGGHIGNWELFGAYLAHLNYAKINVVAKRIYYDKLNDLLINIRKFNGVNTMMRSESTKEMVKCLKNNECLGILIDQDTNVKSCFVNFFGKKAYTPIGATVFAMHYNPVILPVFIARIAKNRHKLFIKTPINLVKTQDKKKDVFENTQKFSDAIEEHIKNYPAQWVWMHKRWKTKI